MKGGGDWGGGLQNGRAWPTLIGISFEPKYPSIWWRSEWQSPANVVFTSTCKAPPSDTLAQCPCPEPKPPFGRRGLVLVNFQTQ